MKINEIYKHKKNVISFEIFPPKKDDDLEKIYPVLDNLVALSPDFVSVTCGAGGVGGKNNTIEVASILKNKHKTEPMAHLTCISSNKEQVKHSINEMKNKNIENVLALRGDIPKDMNHSGNSDYIYAKDLIADIRSYSGICIAGAAYPEGHIDCDNLELNIEYLKQKEDMGAEFFVTQLCFDNNYIYSFLEKVKKVKIKSPVSIGIMPMMSRAQIERMIFLCGASLPSKMIKLLNKYSEDSDGLLKAGLEYAGDQISDLVKIGVDGVHIYCMNKPDVAKYCIQRAK